MRTFSVCGFFLSKKGLYEALYLASFSQSNEFSLPKDNR